MSSDDEYYYIDSETHGFGLVNTTINPKYIIYLAFFYYIGFEK